MLNHAIKISNDNLPTPEKATPPDTSIHVIGTNELEVAVTPHCTISKFYFNKNMSQHDSSLLFQTIQENFIQLNRPFSLVIEESVLEEVRKHVGVAALLANEVETRVIVSSVPYANIYQKEYKNMKLSEHIMGSIARDEEVYRVLNALPGPLTLEALLTHVALPDYTFAGSTELRSYDYSHLFEQVLTHLLTHSAAYSLTHSYSPAYSLTHLLRCI